MHLLISNFAQHYRQKFEVNTGNKQPNTHHQKRYSESEVGNDSVYLQTSQPTAGKRGAMRAGNCAGKVLMYGEREE